MTPTELLELLKQKWRLCLAGAVVAALSGFFLTYLQAPQYRAETLLAPSSSQGSARGLGSFFGPLQSVAGMALGLGEDGSAQRAIAILRSRAFSEKFVVANNLINQLDRPGRLARLLGAQSDPQSAVYRAARTLRTSVQTVRVDPKTGFVTIGVKWSDPQLAANWANMVAAALNEEMRTRAITDSERAIRYLESELQSQPAVPIRAAIHELIESQLHTKMLAHTQPEYVYTVLEPAMPPHKADFVSPNRALTAAVCGVLGAICGLLFSRGRR